MKKALFLLLPLLLFISCEPEEQVPEIEMPSTPIMSGTVSWGVVNVSYLKISREADSDQHIITTLRQGDVVRIESVHTVSDGRSVSTWYKIRMDNLSGWVREKDLDSYSTREKADTASEIMIRGNVGS